MAGCICFYSYVTGRYIGAVNIVSSSDTRSIETFNKSKNHYAIKVQEKDKYFLEVYGVGDSGKYTIDKDKFDSIHEGNYYWFYIKFIKPGESSSGSIERVYTASPLK